MKYVLIASFLLSVIKVSHSHNSVANCAYLKNNTESVVVTCNRFKNVTSIDTCFDNLFKRNSKEINRLAVKQLKVGDKWCADSNVNLDTLFANIRELDFSFALQSLFLSPHDSKFKYLEKFNLSHNSIEHIARWNFQDKPNLMEIDLSFNEIVTFPADLFENNVKLTAINLSHNSLASLNPHLFSKLSELKVLDFSVNAIQSLDKNIFRRNTKLEILRMDVNPLKRFDCNWFLSMENLRSLEVPLRFIDELDLSCDRCLVYFDWNNANEVIFRLPNVENDLRFGKADFKQLNYFNVNGNRFENISEILNLLGSTLRTLDLSGNHLGDLDSRAFQQFTNLEVLKLSDTNLATLLDSASKTPKISSNFALSLAQLTKLKSIDISNNNLQNLNFSSLSLTLRRLTSLKIANSQLRNIADLLALLSPFALESLDVSHNFVGQISAMTFRRFTNLQSLNLSHTNLSNFRFSTFYHQSKLQLLDISYNNLAKVDFTLFTRRFNNLSTLNLEGNNLTNINSVNQLNFPKLVSLGISKNRFSCHYLIEFLNRWPSLEVIENPSDGTHVDGIDCFENENESDGHHLANIVAGMTNKEIINGVANDSITDLRAIKYLLILLCIMFSGYLIVKSNVMSRIKRRLPMKNPEGNVVYRQTTMDREHSVGLIRSSIESS